MAQPVLVRAYTDSRPATATGLDNAGRAQALPPISSFAFADILRSADCADFQVAIDGIAEICAKNRMSLADEYASHLPPLGEITATTSSNMRPQAEITTITTAHGFVYKFVKVAKSHCMLYRQALPPCTPCLTILVKKPPIVYFWSLCIWQNNINLSKTTHSKNNMAS